MDARVSVVLLALTSHACVVSSDGPLTMEFACSPPWITVERAGATSNDFALWDLEMVTPHGTEKCAASRGGWVCSSQRIDGRAILNSRGNVRGLPPRSLLLPAADVYNEFAGYRFSVFRNGVLRYDGPALCEQAACGPGNTSSPTLPVGGEP